LSSLEEGVTLLQQAMAQMARLSIVVLLGFLQTSNGYLSDFDNMSFTDSRIMLSSQSISTELKTYSFFRIISFLVKVPVLSVNI